MVSIMPFADEHRMFHTAEVCIRAVRSMLRSVSGPGDSLLFSRQADGRFTREYGYAGATVNLTRMPGRGAVMVVTLPETLVDENLRPPPPGQLRERLVTKDDSQ